VSGAKALEVRQVEADASLGRVVKKKGESEEDAYFLGGGGKKGKKGGAKKKGTPLALGQAPDEAEDAAAPAASANAPLNVPLGTLSALLALSIPPPTSSGDVPRVVDNLKLKREYFVSNQAQQTRANIEKVEKGTLTRRHRTRGAELTRAPSHSTGQVEHLGRGIDGGAGRCRGQGRRMSLSLLSSARCSLGISRDASHAQAWAGGPGSGPHKINTLIIGQARGVMV
jgi:hypothetical protein